MGNVVIEIKLTGGPFTADAGGFSAMSFHLIHDIAPSALGEHRIRGSQTGFEDDLVETISLAFDFEEPLGNGTILGFQRPLFPGPAILQVRFRLGGTGGTVVS